MLTLKGLCFFLIRLKYPLNYSIPLVVCISPFEKCWSNYQNTCSIHVAPRLAGQTTMRTVVRGCTAPCVYPAVPDGGWGWAVAVAFFIVEVCTYGTIKSLGVFLQDLMEEFGESNSRVSWVISICVFVLTFTGQLSPATPSASLPPQRGGWGCCYRQIILLMRGWDFAVTIVHLKAIEERFEDMYKDKDKDNGKAITECHFQTWLDFCVHVHVNLMITSVICSVKLLSYIVGTPQMWYKTYPY